ncbi:MAG: beta-glucosidase [Pleurocapsa minor GSE-CHR-MK-17-07R]|jgi:beta-glucosidase|nr:beta-glucosidase [Pleurocapsa minor GSE-CHR-MK 17-07R]
MKFPDGFLWGSATSSYQIEGAVATDGRLPSIWDTFSHTPGRVLNGDTGDIANRHYELFRDDVAMMADLGLQAYRFSIAWPRVFPQGVGPLNEKGLAFYDSLVDALLEKNIEPMITLYHWDLPQALQETGGWQSRDTVHAFADYAALIAETLGDRVKHIATHNEPWCVGFLGHWMGEHAPGERGNLKAALQVIHHVLLSHGLAVQAMRAIRPEADLGIVLNHTWSHAASDSEADIQAAHRHDGFFNRWFLDPLFRGEYPADMLALYGDDAPVVQAGDLDNISTPIDFLGVNYYTRSVVADSLKPPLLLNHLRGEGPRTAMDWEVYAPGLCNILTRIHQDYHPKALYVTENGAAYDDVLDATTGGVHDPDRIEYLRQHLEAAKCAIDNGAPLKGYFVWSLMDNFEWAWGFDKRFGIVYVDYASQKRVLKDSALWFRELIVHNGW